MHFLQRLTLSTVVSWTLFTSFDSHAAGLEFAAPTVSPDDPVVAMWSNENAVLLFWIYGEPSTCPETRRTAKSVLTIVPSQRLKDREWSYAIAAELPICLERLWDGSTTICRGGIFRLQYFDAEQEYRGDYQFKMSDGTQRSKSFRAKYCPVGP
jgi:hypothetical protein